MHIPPGFLEPKVWIPMAGISAASVGYALKKTGNILDERKTPVLGVIGAFIFAAQMVNFPVAGGTSGHLMGAALAVGLFGVWPSIVIMASVVLMQALLFQDGGIDALGANIFNMSVAGCVISGLIIGTGTKKGSKIFYLRTAFGAWLAVVVASVLCALELALSGTSPIKVVLPAMVVIHSVIGIFEGIITVVALRFIYAVKPELSLIPTGTDK